MEKSRYYTDEFKTQIVKLKAAGKLTVELSREYGIAKSSITKWYRDYTSSGSFTAKDNITDQEMELRRLRKETKQLKMEVDILKQAALIMARNDE